MKRRKDLLNEDELLDHASVEFWQPHEDSRVGFDGLTHHTLGHQAVALGYNVRGFLIEALILENVDMRMYKEDGTYQGEIVRRAKKAFSLDE